MCQTTSDHQLLICVQFRFLHDCNKFFAKVILLFGITKFFPDYVKEIRQIMEYVQLEGIHIHEDGYAKFIELTLLLSLVACAIICTISLFVTEWIGLPENWCTMISVFLGITLGLASKKNLEKNSLLKKMPQMICFHLRHFLSIQNYIPIPKPRLLFLGWSSSSSSCFFRCGSWLISGTWEILFPCCWLSSRPCSWCCS